MDYRAHAFERYLEFSWSTVGSLLPLHDSNVNNWFREAPAVIPNNVDIEYAVEQSESGDGVKKQPLLIDALSYLDLIKVEFHDQPETYNLFLEVMKAFKAQILDTQGVIDHVAYLFEGRVALFQRFNSFLPPGGYRMPLDSHSGPNFSWSI